jgi:transcription antitermination factor NusG
MTYQKSQWFVFYTFPRAKKVVAHTLQQRKYESFLPLFKTIRVWKNRQKKKIYRPLFPGYIFVKTVETEIHNILQIPQISTYIKIGNTPCVIKNDDINKIKRILNSETSMFVDDNFHCGDPVRIIHGTLSGCEGILIQHKGKHRFGIQLKEINHTVIIDMLQCLRE